MRKVTDGITAGHGVPALAQAVQECLDEMLQRLELMRCDVQSQGCMIRQLSLSPAASSGPRIWHCSSPEDGYFVAVLVAASEPEARLRAWDLFRRSRPDRVDPPNSTTGFEDAATYEWEGYHRDPTGLVITDLGTEYLGSDGEGHLEVEG